MLTDREAELEGAMYTSCLFLGLDPAVLGSPAGAASPASASISSTSNYPPSVAPRSPPRTSTRCGRSSIPPSPGSSARSYKGSSSASLSSRGHCHGATPVFRHWPPAAGQAL